ncbi:MAG: hypothetical protein ABI091_25070 [Ferruginibacter sp.]
MKKLLLIITAFYVTTNIKAQTSNPVIGTYTHDVDSMFQHLNKSGITTGVLYDRVFPL